MKKKDAQWFIAQKAFIEKDGNVLVLHDPVEGLDFPGGKIQEGEEDIIASLKREVSEETGLSIEVGRPFKVHREVFKRGVYAGKSVYFVCFYCEWKSGDVLLSDEHTSFRWVNVHTYKEVDDGTSFFHFLEDYFMHRN